MDIIGVRVKGFPEIRGTFSAVPTLWVIIFWGRYWGPPFWGNYQTLITNPTPQPCLRSVLRWEIADRRHADKPLRMSAGQDSRAYGSGCTLNLKPKPLKPLNP